jgi:hypothetical protein
MLNTYIVPATNIQQVWNKVENMLSSAMIHSGGEYNIDQLKVMLVQNKQTLFVAADENMDIKCASTIEWINHPNDRIAFITAIGGKTSKSSFEQLINLLKNNGCTKIQGAAYESVARLWKRQYGFENRYIIVELKI